MKNSKKRLSSQSNEFMDSPDKIRVFHRLFNFHPNILFGFHNTTYTKPLFKPFDVVTMAKWDKSMNGDSGRKFIERIQNKEFEMHTPYDRKALTQDLDYYDIKDEDIILIIITSIFDLDYLVTFNRKHLKNNEVRINDVLQKHKIRKIKIVLPNEV